MRIWITAEPRDLDHRREDREFRGSSLECLSVDSKVSNCTREGSGVGNIRLETIGSPARGHGSNWRLVQGELMQ